MKSRVRIFTSIRLWLVFIIAGLLISGVTAFPVESELEWLLGYRESMPLWLGSWLSYVHDGLSQTNKEFPFLAYGTDWLAFAHIVIALAFVGPWKDPVRNKWVIEWAMIACILVFPLAFIAGAVRKIPLFHQMIDCSFGLIAIIPLLIIRSKINQLERLQS